MNRQELLNGLDKIAKIGIAKAKAKGYDKAEDEFIGIYLNNGTFEVNFDIIRDNSYFMEFSLDEFEQDIETILAEQKHKAEERIAKAEEAKRHYQAILDKQNKEQEYQSYLRLKQKFENE